MKFPSLKNRIGADESRTDEHLTKTIVEALSDNDKVLEIRPAKRSKRTRLKRLLLLGAGATVFAYSVRKFQKPDGLIGSVKEKTANRTHQAAETIEAGSETASERIEKGSKRVGETVQETGKKVAEQTEETGEKAANETESGAKDSWKT